jgi:hypothetical protein
MFMDSAPTTDTQAIFNDMITLGHRLARVVVEQAEAAIIPAPAAATAFDRVGRCMRRCALIVLKLAEPVKTVDRTAARKRILREVEDSIHRDAHPVEAESLREELLDRLDTLDLEDDIAGRPVEDIIAEIIHDLGLAATPLSDPWKRRTLQDLAELSARARQPASTSRRAEPSPLRPSQTRNHPAGCNSS